MALALGRLRTPTAIGGIAGAVGAAGGGARCEMGAVRSGMTGVEAGERSREVTGVSGASKDPAVPAVSNPASVVLGPPATGKMFRSTVSRCPRHGGLDHSRRTSSDASELMPR